MLIRVQMKSQYIDFQNKIDELHQNKKLQYNTLTSRS
jgi:hypothetical protein